MFYHLYTSGLDIAQLSNTASITAAVPQFIDKYALSLGHNSRSLPISLYTPAKTIDRRTMRPDGPRDPVTGPESGPEPPFPVRLSGPVIKGFGRGSKDVCGVPLPPC